MKISYTRLQTAAECARKWYFRYRLHLKPPPSADMGSGTVIHRILADYFSTRESIDTSAARVYATISTYLDTAAFAEEGKLEQIQKRVGRYVSALRTIAPQLALFAPLLVETELSCKLHNGATFVFKPDAATKEQTKTGLVEIKSGENPRPEQYLLRSIQHLVYLYGLQRCGWKAPYYITYILISPRAAWLEAPQVVPQSSIDAAGRWLEEYTDPTIHRPNYGTACSWCPFNLICETELMGLGTEDIVAQFEKEKEA